MKPRGLAVDTIDTCSVHERCFTSLGDVLQLARRNRHSEPSSSGGGNYSGRVCLLQARPSQRFAQTSGADATASTELRRRVEQHRVRRVLPMRLAGQPKPKVQRITPRRAIELV
jgi:hypothetical protein